MHAFGQARHVSTVDVKNNVASLFTGIGNMYAYKAKWLAIL